MAASTTSTPKTSKFTAPQYSHSHVSLREVMDEELAFKLQEQEREKPSKAAPIPEISEKESEEDRAIKLAMQLSLESSQQSQSQSQSQLPKSQDQEQKDFLYAVQLQNEIDSEQYARHLQETQRAQRDNSKVSISYDHLSPFKGHHPAYNVLYEDELENAEEEEQATDEGEEEEEELQYILNNPKNYHQVSKAGGRQSHSAYHPTSNNSDRDTAPITKHDLLTAGLKNADSIETKLDSGNLFSMNVPISNAVYNSLISNSKKQEVLKTRVSGNKLDKSTNERVLDQRTRVLLLRLLNSGELFAQINGVISTGKEANVYHAVGHHQTSTSTSTLNSGATTPTVEPTTPKSQVSPNSSPHINTQSPVPELETEETEVEYAIKIFKTTLNEFKNRSEYIEGEYRFRNQKASKSNPRKLIKLWAEKEMRNLKRLTAGNIPCPTPIMLREHVLVMSFIGKQGWPAPILKDVQWSSMLQLQDAYKQIVRIMRNMYHSCNLIHADLSEYNLLYRKGKIWVIDVSQAVENDHPKALDFLRKDCSCIFNFFRRKGLSHLMTVRQLFDFVTDIALDEDTIDDILESACSAVDKGKSEDISAENEGDTEEEQSKAEKEITDAVFSNRDNVIPRTLKQVTNPSGELFDNQQAFHHAVTGTNALHTDN